MNFPWLQWSRAVAGCFAATLICVHFEGSLLLYFATLFALYTLAPSGGV